MDYSRQDESAGAGQLRETPTVSRIDLPSIALSTNCDGRVEHVISASVLVTTAFKMRDEAGLLTSLRVLCDAVDDCDGGIVQ